jgi:hypothetical protein
MSDPQRVPMTGEFSGMTKGDVLVPQGADVEISDMVGGDVIVEAGAKAHVSGMVRGKIVDLGGEVRVTGLTG